MNFSAYQWFAVVILDILLRSAFFFVTSLSILSIPIALVLSLMHLTLLILTSYSVIPFERSARITAVTTLLVTNVLFCVAFIFLWVWSIRSGRQTACTGVNHTCDWIDGKITWCGVQTMTVIALIQVVINMVPVLAACGFGLICRRRVASN